MVQRGAALSSLVVDLAFGEPPAPLHPTVAMGRLISARRRRRRATRPIPSLVEGGIVVLAGAAMSAIAARLVERGFQVRSTAYRAALTGAALKPAISLRGLLNAANDVRRALEANDLGTARRLLSWHLVSRDTTRLSPHEVAAAAIESVAENLSDALVGPLLAFRAGGLSAAYAYRMINTADAMLGYHTEELEWFGKVAARLDDAVNLAPSRVTALLIAAASPLAHGSPRAAWNVARRDASLTASPNAGWPMSAMAGALGVRLSKRGQYELNRRGRDPQPEDIRRCGQIALCAGTIATLLVETTL
jgi:adenosylcobinamide-phosphate synthase